MIRLVDSSPSTSSTLTGIFGKNLSAPSSSSLLPSLSCLAPIFHHQPKPPSSSTKDQKEKRNQRTYLPLISFSSACGKRRRSNPLLRHNQICHPRKYLPFPPILLAGQPRQRIPSVAATRASRGPDYVFREGPPVRILLPCIRFGPESVDHETKRVNSERYFGEDAWRIIITRGPCDGGSAAIAEQVLASVSRGC